MAESSKARSRQAREQRLQAALRENLRRRKAQARGRKARAAAPEASPRDNGGNRVKAKDES